MIKIFDTAFNPSMIFDQTLKPILKIVHSTIFKIGFNVVVFSQSSAMLASINLLNPNT